jgi:polysaccharide export outer membrane protein
MLNRITTWLAVLPIFCAGLFLADGPGYGFGQGLAGAAAQTRPLSSPDDLAEYRLGAGDKLRVTVFGETALSGEFLVSGTGKISLPLIGDVQAAGVTVPAFQEQVQRALRDGYLKDPRVSAEVLNYRPFYILGEVEKPGEYPFTNNLTVLNAVATAGGFTYRANKGRVYIKRNGNVDERQETLSPAVKVLPGDTIRIGERLF